MHRMRLSPGSHSAPLVAIRPGRQLVLALAVCAPGLSGCGGVEPATNGQTSVAEGALLPFKSGNTWKYRVTDAGVITEKTTTIGALEAIGGTGPHATEMAYRVTTRKGTDLNDQTESWQAPSPESADRILRFREINYGATSRMPNLETHWDPAKTHVDGDREVLIVDHHWLERYDETRTTFDGRVPTSSVEGDHWTVLSVDESVTAAGERYDQTVHFRKNTSSTTKEYWYKPGVGKIKEIGGQTEELVSFTLVP